MTKARRKTLLPLLSDALFPLLLAVAGGILVKESLRITAKHKPANWLAGPSGFMMIIGSLLLVFTAIECAQIIMRVVKTERRRIHAPVPVAEQAHPKDSSAAITAKDIMTYQTGEEEQTVEERKRSSLRMLISFGLLVFYALLVKILGFTLASTVYIIANLFALKNSWKVSIITTIVVFSLLYFGAPAMSLSLPRGMFGF
jgi:uncharacterized membrane protein